MTTTTLSSSRGTPHGEITIGAGGAITPDVQLTYENALTRDEIVVELEKIKSKLLEIDFPRV